MASETKFTPGPWACITRQGSWDWLVYSKANPRNEICQMFHDNTEFNETGEANARLVAAAPEMLAALKDTAEFLTWNECTQATPQVRMTKADISNALDHAILSARAAIAKAKATS